MSGINYINITKFRELGYLQEVNRLFFHPLGLALEVVVHEDRTESLGGIWDYRDDPEGMIFNPGMIDIQKIEQVAEEMTRHVDARIALIGDVIQSPEWTDES